MSSFMEELEAKSIGTHDRDHVIGVKWWFEAVPGRDGRPPALSEADWDADEVKQMFSHCGKVEKAVRVRVRVLLLTVTLTLTLTR